MEVKFVVEYYAHWYSLRKTTKEITIDIGRYTRKNVNDQISELKQDYTDRGYTEVEVREASL